jgi:hypothetical protein
MRMRMCRGRVENLRAIGAYFDSRSRVWKFARLAAQYGQIARARHRIHAQEEHPTAPNCP